jgi:hypothetical protein
LSEDAPPEVEPPSEGEDILQEDEEDIPDWLARLRASIGPEDDLQEEKREPAPQETAETLFADSDQDAEEELPEWLRQLKQTEPVAEAEASPLEEDVAPEEAAAEPEREALVDAEEAEEEIFSEEEPVVGATAQGEDLQDMPSDEEVLPEAAEEVFSEEEPVVGVTAEGEDLQEVPSDEEVLPEAAEEVFSEEEPVVGATAEDEDLQEVPSEEVLPEAAPLAETEAIPAQETEEDFAAWLQQDGPVILEAEEGEEDAADAIVFQPEAVPQEPLQPSDIPAWLETLAPEGVVLPEELGRVFTPAGKPPPEDVGLERAEIPSWLEDLRPGRKKEEAPPQEPVVESGILAGLRGALQMVEAVDPAPSQRTRPASAPVSATAAHADTLTRLLGEPTSALVKPRVVPTSIQPARGLPWLAFLLLLAAVLIPFFVSGLVPGGNAVPVSNPAADLSAQIQRLNPGDVVLLSVDYDPGVSTELDWPVRVILEDLRAKGVSLLMMSLTPTGPGLAARFDTEAMETLLLGYLPGQEMGLQRLAVGLEGLFPVDFQGSSVSAAPFGVRSLDEVALILTAASSQETVRWWVEQVKTKIPSTPMGAVVSAAIEPAVRPYYASGQLAGLVSGWVGGQAYRQESSPDKPASKEDVAAMEAQSLAHLTIVLLIVLGNVAYLGKRLFGRQP